MNRSARHLAGGQCRRASDRDGCSMARILVHALAATAGGGANYLRNFLGRLGELGASHEWLAMVPSDGEFTPPAANVRLVSHKSGRGAFRRVYYDQIALRRLIKD